MSMTIRRGGSITEYIVLMIAIVAGMALLSATTQTRTEHLMNTAIQQIPIP